ncbi:MAG: extracellular solute-binding protein [Dehalococcoidia bacterium]|nr:extracellular solute-binding protein [Dehalococcoidia bacterium]
MRRRAPALAALVALLLTVVPAWAQSPHLAGAQREGKIVWYTVVASSTAQRVAKLFEAAHPGIKVEVHRSGSERVFQRLMQEAQAGIKNADVMDTADIGHIVVLKRRAMLAKYAPAGAERFPDAFRDADGMAYAWRAFPVVIPYNPKLVSAAEAPKNWKDLLDPKWRGKLVTAHPGYAGSVLTQVYALSKLYGWGYFQQLAQQKPMLVQSVHDPFQVVSSGERAVGVNAAEYFVYAQRKKGNPVAIVYPQDGVPLILVPTAVLATAPRPNAARLFTDFVFSKPVQQFLVSEEGLYVPHPEVTYPADKPKLSELKVLPVDAEDLERKNEEIKKRFVELFGA